MREIADISDITELGSYLKTFREDKGISLEQVHNITNIRTKYLVAIEAGDLSQIPGGEVYIRGFLRNYTRAIDLDPDEILSIYKALQKNMSKSLEPVKIPRVDNSEGKGIQVGIKFKTASVILVLIVLTFSFSVFKGTFTKPSPTPNQNGLETISPDDDSDALLDNDSSVDADQDIVKEVEALIVLSHADTGKSVYLVDDDDLTVNLEVLQDRCWISSSLDGTPDFEGTLSQGEIQTFNAKSNITIRIGNPQVIKLIVNNQDLGIPGGTSRNFIFERSN